MTQVYIDSSTKTTICDIDSERSYHMNRVECYDNVDQNECDYSFLQPASCVFSNDSVSQYETVDASITSNMNATFVDDGGMDHYHRT